MPPMLFQPSPPRFDFFAATRLTVRSTSGRVRPMRSFPLLLTLFLSFVGGASAAPPTSTSNAGGPRLASVEPFLLVQGTVATLKGTGLGATQGTTRVRFGGLEATEFLSWSDSQVRATVSTA